MKKLILVLFLLGANGWSVAQTQNMSGDLTKYWYYRWRLRNDFMVMGNGPGESLIAEQRNTGRKDLVKWADASLMQGYYLSMLAIEHKILEDLGRFEDLLNNERELYFALKAFERLDYWTETIYSDEQPNNNNVGRRTGDMTQRGDINGYFYRDDVPPDFFANLPHLSVPTQFYSNYFSMNSLRTGIRYHTNSLGNTVFSHHAEGDFENHYVQFGATVANDCYLCPPLTNAIPYLPIVNHKKGREEKLWSLGEMSQDQAIRLMLGFVTIVKSIPNIDFQIDVDKDGVTDVNFNFVDQARRHATNILGRAYGFRSGTITVDPDEVEFVPNAALFLGPVAFWNTQGPRNLDVEFGDYTFYAYPLRKMTPFLFTTNNDLAIQGAYYNTGFQGNFYDVMWKTGVGGYNNDNNSHMAFILNVLANSGPINDNNVQAHLYEKSSELDKDALYMPFYEYLWGWNLSGKHKKKKDDTYYKAQQWLDVAPCVGPHNFGNVNSSGVYSPDHATTGLPVLWNQAFLYDAEKHEWEDGKKGSNNVYYEGWFSGLDYMMLYNTVYANLTTERPMYHDLINRIVDYPIYTSNSTSLTEYSANGLLIGAFEDMKIRNVISGNASVEVKALDFIELQNGAIIDPEISGSIDIYPDKLTCTAGNATGVVKMDECSTCSLEQAMDLSIVPSIKYPIRSLTSEDYLIEAVPFFLSSNIEASELVIYPNPTTDEFFILGGEVLDVHLFDALGNELQLKGELINGYDVVQLAAGIYFVYVKTIDHDEIIKITKQ